MYKGTRYAFREKPDGTYKVMRSSDAGSNWSETLFKDESLNESHERLTDEEKRAYIDIINDPEQCEDIDDLKDIVHEIYLYDKGMFALLNKFPKGASFEELKANKIAILKDSMFTEAFANDKAYMEDCRNKRLKEEKETKRGRGRPKEELDVYSQVYEELSSEIGLKGASRKISSKEFPNKKRFRFDDEVGFNANDGPGASKVPDSRNARTIDNKFILNCVDEEQLNFAKKVADVYGVEFENNGLKAVITVPEEMF